MQEYKLPEMLVSFWQMINNHMCFNQPMSTQKRQSHKYLGDVVINQHQDNCVKVCLTNIQVTKSQSNMETQQCK